MRKIISKTNEGNALYAHSAKLGIGEIYHFSVDDTYSIVVSRETDRIETEDGLMYVYELRDANEEEVKEYTRSRSAEETMNNLKKVLPDLDWGDNE